MRHAAMAMAIDSGADVRKRRRAGGDGGRLQPPLRAGRRRRRSDRACRESSGSGSTNAIDLGVGFYGYGLRGGCFRDRDGRAICDRRYGHGSTSIHLDYLWQSKLIDKHGAARLARRRGRARGSSSAIRARTTAGPVGARAPIGLDLTFNQPSFLEVFMEIAPVFYVGAGDLPGAGRRPRRSRLLLRPVIITQCRARGLYWRRSRC